MPVCGYSDGVVVGRRTGARREAKGRGEEGEERSTVRVVMLFLTSSVNAVKILR